MPRRVRELIADREHAGSKTVAENAGIEDWSLEVVAVAIQGPYLPHYVRSWARQWHGTGRRSPFALTRQ